MSCQHLDISQAAAKYADVSCHECTTAFNGTICAIE